MQKPPPPTSLLSIDPGENTGWALFQYGALVGAGVCLPEEVHSCAHGTSETRVTVDTLVIEWPRERTHGRRIAASSIIELAARAGVVLGSVPHAKCTRIHPEEWKGNIPKPRKGETYIIEERVRSILQPHELLALPAKLRHDAFDAVGLGLFALGRATRGLRYKL